MTAISIPIMTFLSHWFYSGVAIPKYEDEFQYLFNMLLKSSKSDPFITSEAFIYVKMDTPYILLEFLPGPHFLTYSWLPALEVIIRQSELTISWSSQNISSLCNAGATYGSCEIQNTAHTTEFISFWVLSSTIRIKEYLDAKSRILAELLIHKCLQDSVFGCHFRNDILGALRSGFGIMMLLREWLRSPNRKLSLVQNFMNRVITLLLVHGATDFEKSCTFEEISRQALKSDLYIVGVWKNALREARNESKDSNFRKYSIIATHLENLKNEKYRDISASKNNNRGLGLKTKHNNLRSFHKQDPRSEISEEKKPAEVFEKTEMSNEDESEWETDEEPDEELNHEATIKLRSLINFISLPVSAELKNYYEYGDRKDGNNAQISGIQFPSSLMENPPGPTGKLRWIASAFLWILNSIV